MRRVDRRMIGQQEPNQYYRTKLGVTSLVSYTYVISNACLNPGLFGIDLVRSPIVTTVASARERRESPRIITTLPGIWLAIG